MGSRFRGDDPAGSRFLNRVNGLISGLPLIADRLLLCPGDQLGDVMRQPLCKSVATLFELELRHQNFTSLQDTFVVFDAAVFAEDQDSVRSRFCFLRASFFVATVTFFLEEG